MVMKKLFAIYLILHKGYSVLKFKDMEREDNGKEYGSCDSPLGYCNGHEGSWGTGDTPHEAVLNCYKNRLSRLKKYGEHIK